MQRHYKLYTFLLFFLVFYKCQQKVESTKSQQNDKPNIVLIVADDHGTDDMGCYGNGAIQTPNLDKLAAEGIRFNKAYCTTASCSASRSVILTGLYNHANGQYGHQHNFHHFSAFDNVKSLPVILHDNGYTTARIGKYHVAPEEVFKFDHTLKANDRNSVEMANISKKFIDEHTSDPFFLYFCTGDPHRGGGIVADNPYKPNRFGNLDHGYEGVKQVLTSSSEVTVLDFLPNNQACREELAQYYESVNRVDQGVGKLIKHLKDANIYDNTIIIYISDNGIAFPGAKTNLYNAGMRLPCIIRNPLIPRVLETSDAMINWADLAPTILDFAGVYNQEVLSGYLPENERGLSVKNGIPVFNNFHGKSFKKVMETGDITGWNETYASHTFHEITMYYPMRVAMDRKYKLIWNIAHGLEYPFATDLWASATWQSVLNDESPIKMYGPRAVDSYLNRPKFELYDIESDPLETKNLSEDPDYEDILKKMKEKLKSFQKRTQDPWIAKWKHE